MKKAEEEEEEEEGKVESERKVKILGSSRSTRGCYFDLSQVLLKRSKTFVSSGRQRARRAILISASAVPN